MLPLPHTPFRSMIGLLALCCLVTSACENPDRIYVQQPDASTRLPMPPREEPPPWRRAPNPPLPDEDSLSEPSDELRRRFADPGTAERACQDFRVRTCQMVVECADPGTTSVDKCFLQMKEEHGTCADRFEECAYVDPEYFEACYDEIDQMTCDEACSLTDCHDGSCRVVCGISCPYTCWR